MIVRRRVPGFVQTNFKPSRISSWIVAVLGRDGAGVLGRASNRAINSGRNVKALKVNAPTTPMAPMSAAAFRNLEDLQHSFLIVEPDDHYAIKWFVFVEGEVEVICNHAWPFLHAQDMHLQPPLLEIFE
jgi:hypothetical protein